eukprot:2443829-Pyramimonas_sp.AAC.1
MLARLRVEMLTTRLLVRDPGRGRGRGKTGWRPWQGSEWWARHANRAKRRLTLCARSAHACSDHALGAAAIALPLPPRPRLVLPALTLARFSHHPSSPSLTLFVHPACAGEASERVHGVVQAQPPRGVDASEELCRGDAEPLDLAARDKAAHDAVGVRDSHGFEIGDGRGAAAVQPCDLADLQPAAAESLLGEAAGVGEKGWARGDWGGVSAE